MFRPLSTYKNAIGIAMTISNRQRFSKDEKHFSVKWKVYSDLLKLVFFSLLQGNLVYCQSISLSIETAFIAIFLVSKSSWSIHGCKAAASVFTSDLQYFFSLRNFLEHVQCLFLFCHIMSTLIINSWNCICFFVCISCGCICMCDLPCRLLYYTYT
jgi:hypothetical protein